EERVPPDGGLRIVEPVCVSHRRLRPRRIFRRGVCDDRDEHVGMSVATELEALALERPGLVRLDPEGRGVPRYRVLLAAKVRHPERVDDVLRGQLELDLLTDRDVELLARLKGRAVLKLERGESG